MKNSLLFCPLGSIVVVSTAMVTLAQVDGNSNVTIDRPIVQNRTEDCSGCDPDMHVFHKFENLCTSLKEAASVLGFDEASWDNSQSVDSQQYTWNELPDNMKDAAEKFCWTETEWNLNIISISVPNAMPNAIEDDGWDFDTLFNLPINFPFGNSKETIGAVPPIDFPTLSPYNPQYLSPTNNKKNTETIPSIDLTPLTTLPLASLPTLSPINPNETNRNPPLIDFPTQSPDKPTTTSSIDPNGTTEVIPPIDPAILSSANPQNPNVINSENTEDCGQCDPYKYGELYFEELCPSLQAAALVLGYNKNRWNNEKSGEADKYWWDDLPNGMKEAAKKFCWTEKKWDSEDDNCGQCDPYKYDELYFEDLCPSLQDAALSMGYNKYSWNNDNQSAADKYWWYGLPSEMKEAAKEFCWNRKKWDSN